MQKKLSDIHCYDYETYVTDDLEAKLNAALGDQEIQDWFTALGEGYDDLSTQRGGIIGVARNYYFAMAIGMTSLVHAGGNLNDETLIDSDYNFDDYEALLVIAAIAGVALVARPLLLKRLNEELVGTTPGTEAFAEAVERVAALAYKQYRPMDNIPGDAAYRREMVPVYVRRTILAAAAGTGPVHHI